MCRQGAPWSGCRSSARSSQHVTLSETWPMIHSFDDDSIRLTARRPRRCPSVRRLQRWRRGRQPIYCPRAHNSQAYHLSCALAPSLPLPVACSVDLTIMATAPCHGQLAFALLLVFTSHSRTLAFVCSSPINAMINERYSRCHTKPLPASSSASCSEPSHHLNVRVYDNVFSSEACDIIHELAIDHQYRATTSDGSSIFYRPPEEGVKFTPLELAIDSALTALNDTSRVVEYWSREEYLNIDAHADVDEGALEDEGQIRCPTFGHVLYLQVDENVRGPTLVFDKMGGWRRGESKNSGGGINTEMATVPCVPGRVLRFDGRAMHAVPKPFDRYLLTDKEEKILREKEADELYDDDDDREDELYDDYDEIDDVYDQYIDDGDELRSVLLFNTWSDGPPPRFVDADYASGALPLGIEIDTADDDDENNSAANICDEDTSMVVGRGDNGYMYGDTEMLCNSVHEWENVTINTVVPSSDGTSCDGKDGTSMNVNLMGNKQRRCYPTRRATMHLPLPAQTFKDAIGDASQPSWFVMISDDKL